MKISSATLTRSAAKADLFIVGCFKGEKGFNSLKKIEPVFYKTAQAVVLKKRFEGKNGEIGRAHV